MSKDSQFVVGSDNVFADIDLENADELMVKSKIMAELAHVIQERGFTQKKASELLGIPQSEISKIVNGRLSRFSLQRLIELLTVMNRNVKIIIEPSEHRGKISIEGISENIHL